MEEKIKEMKKKAKELEIFLEKSYEDLGEISITELDKKIIEKHQILWEDILEICKTEQIKDMEEFDEKYPVLKWGLEDFVERFSENLDYCAEMDSSFLELEIKFLKEVMGQFKLEKEQKQQYELLIIRDTYIVGKEKEAKTELEKFIKKYPSLGEGYEVKCNWELDKENPDMEKVAKILDEAENNETYVEDEAVYEHVIEYFKEIGNHEMAEYYSCILENICDYDLYDEEIEDYYEDEAIEEERRLLIKELKEIANDRVEKNKKFEEYISNKNEMELYVLIGLQAVFMKQEEIQSIQKNTKKYVIENLNNIIRENMVYMSENIIRIINKMPASGFKEIYIEECNAKELIEIRDYYFLKQLGMAFLESKDTKIKIHMPMIKEMKKCITDNEIIKRNKKFNEKTNIIIGICELHGAIKARKVHHIMEEFYGENDKEKFARFMLLVCEVLGKSGIKIDNKTGSMQFIYHNCIDEKTAKDIIKSNKEDITYTKEEYLKYGTEDFLKNLKGYKKLEKQFCSQIFYGDELFEVLDNILMPYSMKKRLGEEEAENIVNKFVMELENFKKDIPFLNINLNKVKEGFEEIGRELPKWK